MKGYDLREGGREGETEDGQRGQVSCLPLGAERRPRSEMTVLLVRRYPQNGMIITW